MGFLDQAARLVGERVAVEPGECERIGRIVDRLWTKPSLSILGIDAPPTNAAPNDAETLAWSVPTLAYVGRTEEAIARGARVLALSPGSISALGWEREVPVVRSWNESPEESGPA